MIEVWTWPTPNGHKVHIALEELGLPYKVIPVNIGKGDQFKPEFLAITPNHRIPAIVDPGRPGWQAAHAVRIGGDHDLPVGEDRRKADPEGSGRPLQVPGMDDVPDGRRRADVRPVQPLRQLRGRKAARMRSSATPTRWRGCTACWTSGWARRTWLAGDEYSMADIITFPWIRNPELRNVNLDDYPNVKRWHDAIAARPAVQRGVAVLADKKRKGQMTDAEREIMFGRDAVRCEVTCGRSRCALRFVGYRG